MIQHIQTLSALYKHKCTWTNDSGQIIRKKRSRSLTHIFSYTDTSNFWEAKIYTEGSRVYTYRILLTEEVQ